MKRNEVQQILEEVEKLLAEEALPDHVEGAVNRLLNLVESLCKDIDGLKGEADRLRKLLEEKKRNKPGGAEGTTPKKNHSSNKNRGTDKPPPPLLRNHSSRKKVEIHVREQCPVDKATLPADAVRHPDETVIVQNVTIAPRNIEFTREVYFSPSTGKKYRGSLPEGFDQGDFGPDLRALIIALKYCGNMSEPKIGEFLENFKIEVSKGSLSNILTKSAGRFEAVYSGIHFAGVSSSKHQGYDDTNARVGGHNWHTHILCNDYYTFYMTRAGKFREDVLAVLQNSSEAMYRVDAWTLDLLDLQFNLPAKWRLRLENQFQQHGAQTFVLPKLKRWFQEVLLLPEQWTAPHKCIAQASAISYYRSQNVLPVVEILVCDDAPQFKLTTEQIQLCWVHEGRHYKKLDPTVPQHQKALANFVDSFWDYYARLQSYRKTPTPELASLLREDFKQLFSTKTGYEDLDKRIASTGATLELLTVLDQPECPLHNNASELGARVCARRRDVSLHSRC